MALVYDGTVNGLRARVADLEGEVFGPDASAYRLHQKLTGVEPLSSATVLAPGASTPRTLAEIADGCPLSAPVSGSVPGGKNLVQNPEINSIATDVQTSTIAGGGSSAFPQRIGSTPGSNASMATIGGGYDNTNDQLAGTIAGGAHHVLDRVGNHGTIGGGSYNTISAGTYGTVAGGTANEVSANSGTISGGSNNAASGVGSTVAGGYQHRASNTYATVSGGYGNVASGLRSVVAGGQGNTAGGNGATVSGGRDCVASADWSSAAGYKASAPLVGQHAEAAGMFAAAGDAQGWRMVAKKETVDATPSSVQADTGGLMTLADSATWAFDALVVAGCPATGERAAYKIDGAIKRDSGAATTALLGSPVVTVIHEDVAGWAVSAEAEPSAGRLAIRVTGEAAKTIRWVVYLRVVQLGW